MHPLIITPLYPPAVGGAATYYGTITPLLAQHNDIETLTILTERIDGQPRVQQVRNRVILRLLPPRIAQPQGARWHDVGMYLYSQLWFMAKLPKLVREQGIDIVQFHSRYQGWPFLRALERCRLPIIVDQRDKLNKPRQLAKTVDYFSCCCESVYRFILDQGICSDLVGLNPIFFQPPHQPAQTEISAVREKYDIGDDPYLLFAGDITYNKGIFDLLEAFAYWRQAHVDVKLLIAGTNREGRAFKIGLQNTTGAKYLGALPAVDVYGLMAGAEIVALPSRSEGLARVILEALALGRKVIAPPDIPEYNRYISDFVLPVVDVENLIAMLDKVWHTTQQPRFPFFDYPQSHTIDFTVALYTRLLAEKKAS